MPILNWLTRDDDLQATKRVPYRLLEEVPELSYGDNLEALKSLLPFLGRPSEVYLY